MRTSRPLTAIVSHSAEGRAVTDIPRSQAPSVVARGDRMPRRIPRAALASTSARTGAYLSERNSFVLQAARAPLSPACLFSPIWSRKERSNGSATAGPIRRRPLIFPQLEHM